MDLRSKVPVAPRPGAELRLRGIPRKKGEILALLLVQNLVPEEFKIELKLYQEHLLRERKFTVKERNLFLHPDYYLLGLHPREVFGNLVPLVLKLMGNLAYYWYIPRKASKGSRIRGYRDQGSKRPDSSPSLNTVRFHRSDEEVQQTLETQDILAELLGPAELEFIESRGHNLDSLPPLSLEEAEKLNQKVDDSSVTSKTLNTCELSSQPATVIITVGDLIGKDNPYCSDCQNVTDSCFSELLRTTRYKESIRPGEVKTYRLEH